MTSAILAERVIRTASREHPADRVLRETLKSERGLLPAQAADVSRAVFAYYRWRGWLQPQEPLGAQIKRALTLADAFAKKPNAFSDSELSARALPSWVRDEVDAPPGWERALQNEPTIWLRARPGMGRELAKRLGGCHPYGAGPLADILKYSGKVDLFRTPEFHSGLFEIQDINSQVVGLICTPQSGETWWDACAGEGGKLLHLSDLMKNKGLIWASDRAEWRLRLLKRRAARAKVFNYRAALWLGGARLPTKTRFDGVLVDAPCTGLGTWQRNPDARWTITLEDVSRLAKLQLQLLANAASSVKPSGKLVYCVCTLTRSETLAVVDAFALAFPAFQRLELRHPFTPAAKASRELWCWPQEHGGNGMFVAAWTRHAG